MLMETTRATQPADTLPPPMLTRTALYLDQRGRTVSATVRQYRQRERGILLVLDQTEIPDGDSSVLAARAFYAAWTGAGCTWPCRFFEHWPATSETAPPDDDPKGEIITEFWFPTFDHFGPHRVKRGQITAFLEPTGAECPLGAFWALLHPLDWRQARRLHQMPTWVLYGWPEGAQDRSEGRYLRLLESGGPDPLAWTTERADAVPLRDPDDVRMALELTQRSGWGVTVRQLAAWETQP